MASEILVLSTVPKLVLAADNMLSAAFKSDLALANWVLHPSKVVEASLMACLAAVTAADLKESSSVQEVLFSSFSAV